MHDTDDDDRICFYDVENGIRKVSEQCAAEFPMNRRIHFGIFENADVCLFQRLPKARWKLGGLFAEPFNRLYDVTARFARYEKRETHLPPNSSALISAHGRAVVRSR